MDVSTATDYLRLPISWTPSRRFAHGQPYEYRLVMGPGEVATLRSVPGKGWALTINHDGTGQVTDRGLFATLYDALMAIYSEYFAGHSQPENSQLLT